MLGRGDSWLRAWNRETDRMRNRWVIPWILGFPLRWKIRTLGQAPYAAGTLSLGQAHSERRLCFVTRSGALEGRGGESMTDTPRAEPLHPGCFPGASIPTGWLIQGDSRAFQGQPGYTMGGAWRLCTIGGGWSRDTKLLRVDESLMVFLLLAAVRGAQLSLPSLDPRDPVASGSRSHSFQLLRDGRLIPPASTPLL